MINLDVNLPLVFALFCRIGGCLMVVPGFSSARVPVRVRLLLAVALTLALAPVIVPDVAAQEPRTVSALVLIIFHETALGVAIGILARIFVDAFQFMTTAIASYTGLGSIPGLSVVDTEQVPALATLLVMLATVLIFVTDLHWEIVRGLVASYDVIPLGTGLDAQANLVRISDMLSKSFLVVLRISAPFLVYGILLNLLFGILNKLVTQVPAYFISIPLLISGGFFLLYFAVNDMMSVFFVEFTRFVVEG